ncbi:methyl-accepting chemotaxis protein [Neobacillus sp. MM2021_6]|uniref:methyl-accepting chemotaxis protein n=1 Tax=Bacillaceae TaxID=186817 RepID=UPI00140A281A|nr:MULTISPECIES: methyl-accepting chemotaxis protein [Bacillaceae]MBO0961048.1 methyl-accepting chemotaxis protein [Neobacillus sp. MM2021_6]NHC21336.1 methyl-accepting chemotaxis protein [Bacillus sp. MM2020_4]
MKAKEGSKFKLRSTKTKLIAGMTAVSIIPTISIAIISNLVTQDLINKQVSSLTHQVTDQVSDGLDYKLKGVVSQLDLLSHNIDFTEFYENEENAVFGEKLLEGTLKTNNEYALVYFASTKKDMVSSPKLKWSDDYDPTKRDWYKSAIQNHGKVSYSEPYKDASTGELVLTISQTVIDKNGNVIGVMAIDLDMTEFSKSIKRITIGKEGYMTIVGKDGKYIYHPKADQIGSDSLTKISLWKEMKQNKQGESQYELDGTDKFSSYITNDQTGWRFVSTLDNAELTDTSVKIRNIGWILTAIFGLLSAICAFFISRKIGKNILHVKDALGLASKGDFSTRVSIDTNDEFKELEHSFNDMMEQLSNSLHKVGDTSKSVLDTSAHLSVITNETNAALSEVALAIEEIAQGAGLQAKNIQVSYDQMRGLSQQLDEISLVTENMNHVSTRSMELSSKGLEKVVFLTDKTSVTKFSTDEVAAIVKDVDVRMEEINTIIEVITRITDQTNLLSLNASIESARAGEHGRGFAVVANEVRKLAEQSKASADEIRKIVNSIKAVVKNAVEAMQRTNQAVTEQDMAVSETKSIFNDILSSVHELVQKAEDVKLSVKDSQSSKETLNQEMDSITAVSEETAAATEEVSASTEEISVTMRSFSQHANGLKELSEKLDQEIKKFKIE